MIRPSALSLPFLFPFIAGASSDTTGNNVPDTAAFDEEAFITEVESSFTYQRGEVPLENGVATLRIPEGFKFLDAAQSMHVIVDLWGNPGASNVQGMILREQDGVLSDASFAFVVQYDEMGYVKDSDAGDIDHDDLLKELQKDEEAENEQRREAGFAPAYTVGWAAAPFYDAQHKVLHWAKEIQFGDEAGVNTLNYNVRVLGRKGVLILNAVASMAELALVQENLGTVLGIVQFNDGHRYDQFDSNVDEVAAWTIGGLVAGKVLAKAGILALLLKNIKLVIIALTAAGAGLWKWFGGRKKSGDDLPSAPQA